MGQMLNENDAIMTHDGRMALCIRAHRAPPHLPYPPSPDTHRWSYDMFDEGRLFTISNDDIRDELDSGGHVIIMDI